MFKWENIVKVGTIAEINAENKALAKVKISSRVSDFLPVLMFANSFKRRWEPVRVGEQVTVFCPFGNPNFGLVIRGIFNSSCKEPVGASDTCEVTEYEDGTRFSYDTKSKKLTMFCVGDLNTVTISFMVSVPLSIVWVILSGICVIRLNGTKNSEIISIPDNILSLNK
jgi:phage baseplate assembly protein V